MQTVSTLFCRIEQFSIECRKTKTKVITLANPKETDNRVNQSKLEANTCCWHEARENVRERVTIGFGFTPDWPRKWREIFKPITKRSERKTKANANYFRHSSENRSMISRTVVYTIYHFITIFTALFAVTSHNMTVSHSTTFWNH